MRTAQAVRGKKAAAKTDEREIRTHRAWSVQRLTAAGLIVLFLLGASLRLVHFNDVRRRSPDEQFYTQEARSMAERGFALNFNMARKAGYLFLLAGVMKATGITDERAGALVSLIASLASLAVVGVIGFRFLPPWPALYAMLAMAASSLPLMAARRCWQESLMECLGGVMVWMGCEVIRAPRRWWPYAVLLMTGAFAVLIKHLAAFVFGGTILFVLVSLAVRRAWRPLIVFGAAVAAAGAVIVVAMAATFGGIGRLWSLWQEVYVRPAANPEAYPWALANQSGPWYELLRGFWILAPLNLALAFIAIAAAIPSLRRVSQFGLKRNSEQHAVSRLIATVTVLMAAAIYWTPISQNFRYIAPVYGSMYLLGGIGLGVLVSLAERFGKRIAYPTYAALAFLVVLSVNAGYSDFQQIFLAFDVQDLSIHHILEIPTVKQKLLYQ